MDFDPSSFNIFLNGKYQAKRSQSKALCLNPSCKGNRLCQTVTENDLSNGIHKEHQACQGWIHDMGTLKRWHYKHEDIPLGLHLTTDYIQNPIQSIYYMKKFATLKWQDQLFSHFQGIRASIEDELGKIFIQCQRTINNHLSVNHQIYEKLQGFYEHAISFESGIEQYYDKYLKNDLKSIQKTGKIIISNNELMNISLDFIIDELKGIQKSIWSKQFDFDLQERVKSKLRQPPAQLKKQLNVMDLNNKLHEISMKLKVSVNFIQADGGLTLVCWFCPKKIRSKAAVVKLRKQQCRNALFQHLTQSHLKEMSSFCLVPSLGIVEPSIRLSLQQMKREIIVKNMKKVVIIDKQNVGPFKCDDMENYQSYYFINVVSQHTESTVRGKYLLAQTKGRDAADILIIIMITQLKKFKLQEIVLLTKDHFGETLREIFEKMGTKVIISKTHQFLDKLKNDLQSMNLLDL